MKFRSIAVYCSSSNNISQNHKDMAHQVGLLLAKEKIRLVYGGGDTGLMKTVSEACMEAGGSVLGVMTEYLENLEEVNLNITELRIEKEMHARKKQMFLESDGFLVLPGGLGTLDEISEILTWKQIGLHMKPVVFLNYEGFWNPLISLFDQMILSKTTPAWTKDLFCIVESVEEIFTGFKKSSSTIYPPNDKWSTV